MRLRALHLAVPIVILAVFLGFTTATQTSPSRTTVHEWGTFTSIAGADGQAVEWLPLSGPSDLPCFVYRAAMPKGAFTGKIRMETPVLYFYGPQGASLNVNVKFPQGGITEWFPQAAMPPNGGSFIRWSGVKVLAPSEGSLPVEKGESHYYAARDTEASLIRVGDETEKFLFYRGVASFAAPLSATVGADGRTRVWNPSRDAAGDVILFHNRGGATSYQVKRAVDEEVTFDRPLADEENNPLGPTLEKMLIEHGLYPKEAAAMVATWKDSWFEEGTRLIYVVRPELVEKLLPLDISPAPESIARVFVGRIELLMPDTAAELKASLLANDTTALMKSGRFLLGFAKQIVASAPASERLALQQRLNLLPAWQNNVSDRCR